MFSGHTDKENVQLGKPVIKESDVNRVKRNLAVPLQTLNKIENNNNENGRCVNSPVTELANNFTELAA